MSLYDYAVLRQLRCPSKDLSTSNEVENKSLFSRPSHGIPWSLRKCQCLPLARFDSNAVLPKSLKSYEAFGSCSGR